MWVVFLVLENIELEKRNILYPARVLYEIFIIISTLCLL